MALMESAPWEDDAELRSTLGLLAGALWEQHDQVLQLWRTNMENDATLDTSAKFSWSQFADHVPDILRLLCDQWRNWPHSNHETERERQTARAHSQHRWQQGYDIRSLTREWGHFNAALLAIIDHIIFDQATVSSNGKVHSMVSDEVAAHPVSLGQAGRLARAMAAQMLTESMSGSIVQYSELLQTEALVRGREMEAVIEHLRQEERARGQILREAAHDLRGSLGILTGSTSIIDHENLQGNERAQVHRLLQSGVRSLQDMMTDLIDLSRLEAGAEKLHLQTFDVARALRELCETTRPLAHSRNLELHCLGTETLQVEGDEIKVRRIAQNLLLNAINYSQDGHIYLKWQEHDKDHWALTVQDNGPGFLDDSPIASAIKRATDVARDVDQSHAGENEPTVASHIENAQSAATANANTTSQSASRAQGEGVGLTIVKRLCALMNARIELDSQPETGSTFHIILPRSYSTYHADEFTSTTT